MPLRARARSTGPPSNGSRATGAGGVTVEARASVRSTRAPPAPNCVFRRPARREDRATRGSEGGRGRKSGVSKVGDRWSRGLSGDREPPPPRAPEPRFPPERRGVPARSRAGNGGDTTGAAGRRPFALGRRPRSRSSGRRPHGSSDGPQGMEPLRSRGPASPVRGSGVARSSIAGRRERRRYGPAARTGRPGSGPNAAGSPDEGAALFRNSFRARSGGDGSGTPLR